MKPDTSSLHNPLLFPLPQIGCGLDTKAIFTNGIFDQLVAEEDKCAPPCRDGIPGWLATMMLSQLFVTLTRAEYDRVPKTHKWPCVKARPADDEDLLATDFARTWATQGIQIECNLDTDYTIWTSNRVVNQPGYSLLHADDTTARGVILATQKDVFVVLRGTDKFVTDMFDVNTEAELVTQ